MNPKQFFAGLGITVVIQCLLNLILLLSIPILRTHAGFILVCMIAMIGFCIMMYAAARIAADSKLTRLYIQLIMIAVFLKMLVCLALIVGYKKGFDPADHSFIWPFLIIYVSSTVYEVIFLEKVGRQKKVNLP
jgi:hypothetical protein